MESHMAQGACFLQLIIQYLGQGLIKPNYEQIYSKVIERMHSGDEIRMDSFKARLFGVILCGFAWAYNVTKEILCQNSYLKKITNEIINSIYLFQFDYDKKILIVGLCNLFKAILTENLVLINGEAFTTEEVAMILEKIVIMLKASKQNGLEKNNQQQPRKLKQQEYQQKIIEAEDEIDANEPGDSDDFDDSDSDSSDLYDTDNPFCNSKESIHDDKKNLKNLESPISELNEFDYFKEIICSIKANSGNLQYDLNQLIASLQGDLQSYLKEILLSTRIKFLNSFGNQQMSEPRKIVKTRGRKQQN